MEGISHNKRLGHILFSAFSNVVVLMLSIVTGLVLPKYVSIETYAYYKTFILYAGYVGLFHFGFINGIYLKYGGLDYGDLPKSKFRNYTRVLVLMQLIAQVIIFLCLIPYQIKTGLFVSPYVFVTVNILLINVGCYFNLVNQFTRRFVLDGIIQLIQKISCVVGIVVLLLLKSDDYVPYLIVITISYALVLILLLIFDRELVFGSLISVDYKEIKSMISKGFFIMISEYMGLIIVGIDSIIINLFFAKNDFSIYAFAVSIISVMYQLTSVISKPIFPYLKRQEPGRIISLYDDLKEGFILFASLIAGTAIVIPSVIQLYIPKYVSSSCVMQILAATVIIRAIHELLYGNYYKALSLEKLFVRTNMIALAVGTVTDIIAFLLFHSMTAIAIASVISFVIWYIVSDYLLQKNMAVRKFKGDALLLIILALFAVAVSVDPLIGAIGYYLIVFIISLAYCRRINITQIIRDFK